MKRLLSLATLYPNPLQPRFGSFVARQMQSLAARREWEVVLINPIGVPPLPIGSHAGQQAAAVSRVEQEVMVHRPRFTLIPAVGGPFNPAMIVRAVLPLARRLHAAAPFDLVDAQYFYPDGPAAWRVAAELGLPLSIKARGADITHWGHKAYALRRMKHAAAYAGGLLAVSRALAREMATLGLPRDKIAVHYTGLDHSRFRPLGRRRSRERLIGEFGIDVPLGVPLVATVGSLVPNKGQQFVIRALALLPQVRLLLVGEGPDRPALETLAVEAGVAARVHFLGPLDHARLPVVLSAADVMALPSASEGLANAWVEALACGTPLVITDAGGAREVVTRRRAGRIVARSDEGVAEGIRQILADPPAARKVAACADRFSWEANAEALAAHYARLVAPSPPS